MNKKEFRVQARETLAGITKQEFKEMGVAMLEELRSLPEYQNAKTVFCFVGCTNSEPDTLPILKQVVADHKQLCVPKIVDEHHLSIVAIPDFSCLMPSSFGIQEPLAGRPISPEKVDLALLPCLAADESGHRLGHGYGYYDNFMAQYQGKSIILCPSAVLGKEVPTEPHDLPGNMVLTENSVICC